MDKEVKKEVENLVKFGKVQPLDDIQLQMAINQGYVPPKCNLAGGLVMALMNSGEDPCAGCNANREKCGGRPHEVL